MACVRLTPEIERQIVATIRAGAFAHLAAEAAGVPRRLFAVWLDRGRRKQARPPYRTFWLNVLQAKAQARLGAEMEVRKKDPKFWLRYGPGKEADDAPGWTTTGKKAAKAEGLANPAFRRLLGTILQVLAPFPEARQAIVTALEPPEAAAPEAPAAPVDSTPSAPVSPDLEASA
jgi:hypothetical protein